MLKILAKSQNLLKFKSKKFFKFENPIKIQISNTKKKTNFLISDTKIDFIKLR